MSDWLRNLRNPNLYLMVLADAAIFSGAFVLAYLFRFDFSLPEPFRAQCLGLLKYVLALKLSLFFGFGLYRGMWRYTSVRDFWRIAEVALLQSAILVVFVVYRFGFLGFPRSVFAVDLLLTLLLACGLRISIRTFYAGGEGWRSLLGPLSARRDGKRALVIGAGRAGEIILRELSGNPRLGLNVVGFLDDDQAKRGRTIHGCPVLGSVDELQAVAERFRVDELFIAISEATAEEMRRINEACKGSGLPYKILPSMSEIIGGEAAALALREVDYLDLLGRSEIRLDAPGIRGYVAGQTVLVTGCGGSIGSELCRQLVQFAPGRLVLLDAGEYNLYRIETELSQEQGFTGLVPALGSVADREFVRRVFAEHRPGVVFHAAAYKHVPMVERNPWAAVTNNILGSRVVMEAAHEFGTRRFVLVSTDKAVRPANVMGASKRVTELLMARFGQGPTRFMAVRFGNVLGSSGSVAPLFRRQIERGGPVTVTHPEATRYFMSISEAAQLILQAGSMGRRGGEVFVLEMGVPVRIADMARDLIRLSGKEPGRDVEIVFTGLRPGEKLHEELRGEGEDVVRTGHEKIVVLAPAKGNGADPEALDAGIERLVEAARRYDAKAIRDILRELVPEYLPADER